MLKYPSALEMYNFRVANPLLKYDFGEKHLGPLEKYDQKVLIPICFTSGE
jgi:hypothetical protein